MLKLSEMQLEYGDLEVVTNDEDTGWYLIIDDIEISPTNKGDKLSLGSKEGYGGTFYEYKRPTR